MPKTFVGKNNIWRGYYFSNEFRVCLLFDHPEAGEILIIRNIYVNVFVCFIFVTI